MTLGEEALWLTKTDKYQVQLVPVALEFFLK